MNFRTIIETSLIVIKIVKINAQKLINEILILDNQRKSLLKFANTTNILISIENENTTSQPTTENGKENSKSIKVKEKFILVGDSIVSGVNGKGLSTDKFTTFVRNIPDVTSDDKVHHTHTIPFAEKNPKTLIVDPGASDIYKNIDTNGNYEKIYNYGKANAS